MNNKLIESYFIDDYEIKVYRDDLLSPFPGPNNSKIHGVREKVEKLVENGWKYIARRTTVRLNKDGCEA